MTRSPAVLGLDLGTSQVKALLRAPAGTVLGRGAAGYHVSTPRDGWAETDPGQWWRAARSAVRSAVGPARAEVAGLAVVGQMHGLILYSERALAHQRDDLMRASLPQNRVRPLYRAMS